MPTFLKKGDLVMLFKRSLTTHARVATALTLCLLAAPALATTGRSFFRPRSINQDLVLQQAQTQYFITNNKPAPRFTLSSTTFYQASTNSSDLARYFFPNDKTELVIKEDPAADGPADINGHWLNIMGAAGTGGTGHFQSKISIKPTYQSFGKTIGAHKILDALDERLFVEIALPFTQVQTNAQLSEYDIQGAAPDHDGIADALLTGYTHISLTAQEALNHPLRLYGKIKDGIQTLAGLADIKCTIGYMPVKGPKTSIALYANASIPTSYKPKAQYVFEPLIGNTGHWGVGCGITTNVLLSAPTNNSSIKLLTSVDHSYLFQATEPRTFDIADRGPWSHYEYVAVAGSGAIFLPAANFLTQTTRVTPGSTVNGLIALHYDNHHISWETGYNVWYKTAESLNIKNDVPSNILFTPEAFTIGANVALPAPNAQWASNLDVTSATHPMTLSHKIYTTIGVDGQWDQEPFAVAIGGAYELGGGNRSLDMWSAFLTFNLSL